MTNHDLLSLYCSLIGCAKFTEAVTQHSAHPTVQHFGDALIPSSASLVCHLNLSMSTKQAADVQENEAQCIAGRHSECFHATEQHRSPKLAQGTAQNPATWTNQALRAGSKRLPISAARAAKPLADTPGMRGSGDGCSRCALFSGASAPPRSFSGKVGISACSFGKGCSLNLTAH